MDIAKCRQIPFLIDIEWSLLWNAAQDSEHRKYLETNGWRERRSGQFRVSSHFVHDVSVGPIIIIFVLSLFLLYLVYNFQGATDVSGSKPMRIFANSSPSATGSVGHGLISLPNFPPMRVKLGDGVARMCEKSCTVNGGWGWGGRMYVLHVNVHKG